MEIYNTRKSSNITPLRINPATGTTDNFQQHMQERPKPAQWPVQYTAAQPFDTDHPLVQIEQHAHQKAALAYTIAAAYKILSQPLNLCEA